MAEGEEAGGGEDLEAGAAGGADLGEGQGGGQGSDKTILDGNDGGGKAAAPATWPESWRQEMAKNFAGADNGEAFDKELKRLERYSTPHDVYKAFREKDTLLSSGKYKQDVPFPKDGSDDDKAKWREENGIPDAPEGYMSALDGVVIGDADKELVDSFLKSSHGRNMSPEAVRAGIDWYYETQETMAQQQAEADAEYRQEQRAKFEAEMGGELKDNMRDLRAWLERGPEGLKDNLLGARLADGSLLGDNFEAMSFLVSQMREIDPLSTIVPGGGPGALANAETRIKEIQDIIAGRNGKNPQEYYNNPDMQEELAKLVDARDKAKERAA